MYSELAGIALKCEKYALHDTEFSIVSLSQSRLSFSRSREKHLRNTTSVTIETDIVLVGLYLWALHFHEEDQTTVFL